MEYLPTPIRFLGVCTSVAAILVGSISAAIAADSFLNLRFYPGEATFESRPTGPNPITLSFSGEVFETPSWFSDGAEGRDPDTPEERFVGDIVRANGEGSPEAILTLWSPAERAEIEAEMTDAEQSRRNQLLFQNVERSAFIARVLYGPYVLFIVQHSKRLGDDFLAVYPARHTAEGYLLTNTLQDDPMLEFLYFFYKRQLSKQGETAGAEGPSSQ